MLLSVGGGDNSIKEWVLDRIDGKVRNFFSPKECATFIRSHAHTHSHTHFCSPACFESVREIVLHPDPFATTPVEAVGVSLVG